MKATRAFLCFSLFYAVNLVIANDTDKVEEVLNKCKTEVGATDEDVKMLKDKKMPTARTGLCLLTCLYEKSGFIKDGKFNVENFAKSALSGDVSVGGKMTSRFLKEVVKDCKDVENDDKCLLARDIIMCAADSVNRHVNAEL